MRTLNAAAFRRVCAAVACALAVPAGPAFAGFLSSTGPVIAMLGSELFVGEAEGFLDGSGTLAMRSKANAAVSCSGQFTSSAKLGGAGQLECSDGRNATFKFQRLTLRSGHGTGESARGLLSFTYGLSLDASRPYLTLPTGKKLEQNGAKLQLADLL